MNAPEEIRITRVAPPVLKVRDLQKAEVFMRSVLGFRVTERTRSLDDDVTVIELELPATGASMKLIGETMARRTAAVAPGESRQVTLFVEGLVDAVDLLCARGVEFEELPWSRRSGSLVRFARFLGPDDYSFELIEGAQHAR